MKQNEKVRIDNLLVLKKIAPTRSKAQAILMAGIVKVGDKIITKAGETFLPSVNIEVIKPPHPYVSRGGVKIEKALDYFRIPVEGSQCIDAGASTGGFTHCLLLKGAKKVYSIDVGYGQLDFSLREDTRVVVIERFNVRYLTKKEVPQLVQLITADLSFISLTKVMERLKSFLVPGGYFIPLIKPQFEAKRKEIKKGVVRDPQVRIKVIKRITDFAESLGFLNKGTVESPIKGPKGNVEFLGCFINKNSK